MERRTNSTDSPHDVSASALEVLLPVLVLQASCLLKGRLPSVAGGLRIRELSGISSARLGPAGPGTPPRTLATHAIVNY